MGGSLLAVETRIVVLQVPSESGSGIELLESCEWV